MKLSLSIVSGSLIIGITLCWVSCNKEETISNEKSGSKLEVNTKRLERKVFQSELRDFGAIRARLLEQPTEGFDQIWDAIDSLEDSDGDKSMLRELLLGQMCKSGHTDDALNKVLQTLGPGSKRGLVIRSVFRMSPLPVDELFDLQNRLLSDSEKEFASLGIGNSVGNIHDLSLLDPIIFEKRGKLGRKVLESGLASYVRTAKYKGENVEDAFRSALSYALNIDSRAQLGSSLAADLAVDVAHAAPFEVWNAIRTQKIQMDASVIAKVAEQMTQTDIDKAISSVTSNGGSAGVKYAFNYWLQFDTNKANEWFARNGTALPRETRDQILAAFVDNSAKMGNVDQAKRWLDGISDLEQRRASEGKLWAMERDFLRKEVERNPAGIVQDIASGQSKYAEYWLEEAMGTWVTKDFDKAQDWYNQNWKSLPARKSQYVAAAFATLALKQGDASTASQWAALIQDPKTKQRIQDQINKGGPDHKK